MSGFGGNPFADPGGADPFSDPSVTQHMDAAQKSLEEYSPFADDHGGPGLVAKEPDATPAPIVPQPPPPAYEPAQLPPHQPPEAMMEPTNIQYGEQFPGEGEPIVPVAEEPQPQPELVPPLGAVVAMSALTPMTPEQELELTRREPNFPPCFKMARCPIKPCFYHNISLEIPPDRRKFVRLLFFYWLYLCFTLIVNFSACAALLGVDHTSSDIGVNFGFSIVWVILFIPCSFWCWYWCAYNAFKSDSSLRFMFFFFVFFFQFATCAFFSVGVTQSGSSGMIIALKLRQSNFGVFILALVGFILWALGAVISALLLFRILLFYRTSGYSVEKMQEEAGHAVATNGGVRSAVVAGVKTTMQ